MNPEEIELVRSTFATVQPHLDDVADDFYARLFATHPQLRPLFPDDMSEQRVKFAGELEAIVLAIPDFPAFHARATTLGARHRSYGVRAAHYRMLRDVLVPVLAEHAADVWSPEAEAAWEQAYDLVSESMLSGRVPTT